MMLRIQSDWIQQTNLGYGFSNLLYLLFTRITKTESDFDAFDLHMSNLHQTGIYQTPERLAHFRRGAGGFMSMRLLSLTVPDTWQRYSSYRCRDTAEGRQCFYVQKYP